MPRHHRLTATSGPRRHGHSALAVGVGVALTILLAAPSLHAASDARVGKLLDAAARAESSGHLEQTGEHYRRVLERDRLQSTAIDGLQRVSKGRRLPRESPALSDARRRLPDRFLEYETSRFVVLSDAEPSWSREQAQRLERAHHQFLRFARRHGLKPLPLRHRLVCVLFERRDEYQRFAVQHDEVDDPWIAGYYAPAADRVVFYRGDANPSVVDARTRLDEMTEDVEELRRNAREAEHVGAARYARELKRHHRRYRDHVRSERKRVETFTKQINIATVVHEAVHQLMFHTGLQSANAPAPLWLSEGLATAFETDGTRGAFGPDHEHAPRREAFEELLRNERLLDLSQLVQWDAMPPTNEDDLVHVVYHQSYALVTWMSRFRRAELSRFIELHLAEPGPRIPAARHLELFEAAFGDAGALQRKWVRSETGQLERSVRRGRRGP